MWLSIPFKLFIVGIIVCSAASGAVISRLEVRPGAKFGPVTNLKYIVVPDDSVCSYPGTPRRQISFLVFGEKLISRRIGAAPGYLNFLGSVRDHDTCGHANMPNACLEMGRATVRNDFDIKISR